MMKHHFCKTLFIRSCIWIFKICIEANDIQIRSFLYYIERIFKALREFSRRFKIFLYIQRYKAMLLASCPLFILLPRPLLTGVITSVKLKPLLQEFNICKMLCFAAIVRNYNFAKNALNILERLSKRSNERLRL
jgi:hypothetical protein